MALNPFEGLSKLNKEEYQNLSSFELYKKVEELCPSYQEGQVEDLFLFFYFINLLVKNNIDFVVKGGVLLNMFLGKHARPCNDIDVYVKDPNEFFNKVNRVLENESEDFYFKTRWIHSREADAMYYQNTFAFEVSAYHDESLVKKFNVDGTYMNDFDDLKRIRYTGPKAIDEDFYFYGVDLVHMVVIKTLACTSEQSRPIKHLVDLYSLIHLQFDIKEYKKELFRQLENENNIRKSIGIPLFSGKVNIKESKRFFDPFLLTELSAGYNLSMQEMIDSINQWLDTNIN